MNGYNDCRGSYQGSEDANLYENQIYEKEGYDNFIWGFEQTALIRLLKNSFPSFENIQELNFACGTGRICEFLEKHFDDINAIDISDEMVEIAKTKTKNVTYVVTDILNDGKDITMQYDFITISSFVLLAEPELRKAVFEKLALSLNGDNARLLGGLHWNPFSRRGVIHIFQKLKGTPKEKQLRSFSLSDMRALASSTGLEVVTYSGVGFIPRKMFTLLEAGFCNFLESVLNTAGLLKFFGSNLTVVCQLKNNLRTRKV